jgi:hypothetical protein
MDTIGYILKNGDAWLQYATKINDEKLIRDRNKP